MEITPLDYYLGFGLAACLGATFVWAPLQKIAHVGMWIFGLALGVHLAYDLTVATTAEQSGSSAGILADAIILVLGALAGALIAGWLVSVTRD